MCYGTAQSERVSRDNTSIGMRELLRGGLISMDDFTGIGTYIVQSADRIKIVKLR